MLHNLLDLPVYSMFVLVHDARNCQTVSNISLSTVTQKNGGDRRKNIPFLVTIEVKVKKMSKRKGDDNHIHRIH